MISITREKRGKDLNDDLRKSAIKSVVQRGRRALVDGLERRLSSLGIFGDGKRVGIDEIPDQWLVHRERPSIEAALARWEQQGFDAGAAVGRFVREASYTWLNRLAAIRALEVRGLVPPIASLDEAGASPSILVSLADVSPILSQAREVAEALLWQRVFDELATQLGTLFDPHDPHGMVFPGSAAILETLRAFGELEAATWREDDTLGWFYQFFTTKDERAALRKKKGAAFTADDLGPINQFYTPAWVVRFLVDNTLGTLWRRMQPETKIGEYCTLLLPATADDTPKEPKRVRDIKVIDPACGAMHFGVYAFDVLQRMYLEEGIEDEREVPRLILESNLVGIDIDRRAIQIAALNLYLKAAKTLGELGEQPPRDLHLNLGCADAAPPSAEQVNRMRAEINDPALRQAFEVALGSLTYLHAVGSLLDIEADVRAELSRRIPQARRMPEAFAPLPGFLAQVATASEDEATQLDALVSRARELAEAALRANDVAGALAAEDAMLAAKVLSLVGQRYDVVLMNPPYGELMPPATKQYLHRRYPKSKSDIYGAFFELAFRLAEGGGAVGALTSKTFLYLDTFKHVRKLFLETGRLSALVDAGTGILFESFVPVGLTVGWAAAPAATSAAIVIRVVHSNSPGPETEHVVGNLRANGSTQHQFLYRANLADLRRLPTESIAYWAPPAVMRAYEKYPALAPKYGDVRQGLATGDDERFLRYWWEVPEECIGEGKRWVPFAKGGDYSPYYESLLRVVDWKDGGREIEQFNGAVIRNPSYYFREGITYPRIADRFHARLLPTGCIFADTGPAVFGKNVEPLLAYLNSRVAQVLLMAQSVTRHFEVGQVRRLCVPPLDGELGTKLADIARGAVRRAEEFAEGDELDRRFERSWVDAADGQSFLEAANDAVVNRKLFLESQSRASNEATAILNAEMELTLEDWNQIERALGPELRVDENVKTVGTVKTTIDPLSLPEEQARRYMSGVVRGILAGKAVMLVEEVADSASEILRQRFSNGDSERECAELIKQSPVQWIAREFPNYHLQLHKGKPHIIRISTSTGRIRLFLDSVSASSQKLREFLVQKIEPLERRLEAELAACSAPTTIIDLREVISDCVAITAQMKIAIGALSRDCDSRELIDVFRPLVSYLKMAKTC